MFSRWQPPLDVPRTCCTLEVLKMTTSDDRVRGVVTTTLIVRADGRVACRRLPHVDNVRAVVRQQPRHVSKSIYNTHIICFLTVCLLSQLDEAIRCICAPIEKDIFNGISQVVGNV